jgi:transposase-like protein
MVGEIRGDHESQWAAITQVADLLGVGSAETVRKWCRQAEEARRSLDPCGAGVPLRR